MHREKTDHIGQARWQQDVATALVIKTVGKYMNTMGFKDDGHRLFPEEAVFLVDRDEMTLVEHDKDGEERVLSRVEVFCLLGKSDIDMKVYMVYSALREQRFHVYRHQAWSTPSKDWKSLCPPCLCQMLQQSEDSHKKPRLDQASNKDEELPVSFDVYKPQSNFAKNRLEKPDFCVAVISADEAMPSVSRLQATLRKLEIDVQFRLAIVGDSSLTFVEVSDFECDAGVKPK